MRLAALFLAASLVFAADSKTQEAEKVAPYYPSPLAVVTAMLDAAQLQPGELLVDLGSGDGRIILLAARDFGARAVGYELEDSLVKSSRRKITEMDLEGKAEIRRQDLFTADFEGVDVVTIYLLPRAMKRLEPILEKSLKKGARVISHDFTFPNWKSDETIPIDDAQELDGLPHSIYIYRR
jgi:cyclopropane fatty-acyl-phospholipid synthase-like methyltransferase